MRLPKKLVCILSAMAFVVCAGLGAAMAAQEKACDMPVITGEHWSNATAQEKVAFLAGMATIIELEQEVQGETPDTCKTLIQSWVKGIGDVRIAEMRNKLDQWFEKHPDKKSEPVVKVLWDLYVSPKLSAK
ncbi:hypothetical protein [Megalodesulfovibrio paquesii]